MIKERQAKINKLVQEGKEVPKELTEDLKLNDEEIKAHRWKTCGRCLR